MRLTPAGAAGTVCNHMTTALAPELETFHTHRARWLAHRGQFAVIAGADVAGPFPTYAAALAAGYEKFGLKLFLVQHILEHAEVHVFTRALTLPCPT